jgi:hypothetical protein
MRRCWRAGGNSPVTRRTSRKAAYQPWPAVTAVASSPSIRETLQLLKPNIPDEPVAERLAADATA